MEQAPNDWEGVLGATIGVFAIAGKYDELLKALKLKALLGRSDNAAGMHEKALPISKIADLTGLTKSPFFIEKNSLNEQICTTLHYAQDSDPDFWSKILHPPSLKGHHCEKATFLDPQHPSQRCARFLLPLRNSA